MRETQLVATEQTRSRGVSDRFMHHELLITESDLLDHLTIQRHPHYERLFVERRYFRRQTALRFEYDHASYRLQPDSGSLLRVTRPGSPPSLLMRFKELDKGTMNFRDLADKFWRWDRWAHSPAGRDYLASIYAQYGDEYRQPTFQLLVIAHANSPDPADDEKRLAWLFAAVLSVSGRVRRRIYFTTAAAMRRHQHAPLPAAAPIWLRLHDAKPWLAEYQEFIERLPEGPGQKPSARLRGFVAERIASLPRHSLFLP